MLIEAQDHIALPMLAPTGIGALVAAALTSGDTRGYCFGVSFTVLAVGCGNAFIAISNGRRPA